MKFDKGLVIIKPMEENDLKAGNLKDSSEEVHVKIQLESDITSNEDRQHCSKCDQTLP